MGRNLYEHNETYHAAFDECFEILTPLIGRDLREVVFGSNDDSDEDTLRQTRYTQPAMFAVSYSLAKTYLDLGLRPDAMIGHSIGEFVAATIAGVFRLADACKLIAHRGRLMQELPPGAMLSVRAGADDIEPRLTGDLCIASVNSPTLCVVAGPTEQISALASELENAEIVSRPLHTSHAFHSWMMDPIVAPFAELVRSIPMNTPKIRIRSTVTGDWLTDEQATDANYWAEHLRRPVLFADAVSAVIDDDPQRTLLEIGPRKTLATLARQCRKPSGEAEVLVSLSDTSDDDAEMKAFLEAIGKLWIAGHRIRWEALHNEVRNIVSLPVYPFQRQRYFIDPLITSASSGSAEPADEHSIQDTPSTMETSIVTETRKDKIAVAVNEVFESTSGFDMSEFSSDTTFFEIGMDSLILTQTAASIKKEFHVEITFRQLLEEITSASALVDALDELLPADAYVDTVETVVETVASPANAAEKTNAPSVPTQTERLPLPAQAPAAAIAPQSTGSMQSLFDQQLEIMRTQLALLAGNQPDCGARQVFPQPSANAAAATQPSTRDVEKTNASVQENASQSEKPAKKTFGAGARVTLDATALSEHQQKALDTFINSYNQRTGSSKEYAQKHRAYLADPRTVSGFRPDLKEMTYPIVVDRSKGSRLWDIDGNEYVDFTCGFGSNFLGHSPDFVVESLAMQVMQGYEIGPQHPLAGEVARLFCEMTGAERMAFCNTGSEAVLGACRLARTATGREKIVTFQNDYHGILDEVIVRGGAKNRSFPAAAGIPRSMVDNVIVLDYGTEESLAYIRENLDELAAVLVEPVQSRRPEFQPGEFLRDLGELLDGKETALIFDEVICGLRIAPGGAQEHFGVKADIGTYGKIVGGGMPIGAIAGRAKYMNGLDGGFWEFGDDSKPEAGMTYFAGTFVRHPLALAAAYATLTYLRQEGAGSV